jgi:hypothetical protein
MAELEEQSFLQTAVGRTGGSGAGLQSPAQSSRRLTAVVSVIDSLF